MWFLEEVFKQRQTLLNLPACQSGKNTRVDTRQDKTRQEKTRHNPDRVMFNEKSISYTFFFTSFSFKLHKIA